MIRPNFRPIQPLDVDDSALERVNDALAVPTMVRAAPKSAPQVAPPAAPRAIAIKSPPRREEKLTTRLPGYLVDAMKTRALEQRSTVRHVMLKALRDAGFAIQPEDLVPDARKPASCEGC